MDVAVGGSLSMTSGTTFRQSAGMLAINGDFEMRGGTFATNALIHNRAYRNFFLPQRTDVFAGFRTAGN